MERVRSPAQLITCCVTAGIAGATDTVSVVPPGTVVTRGGFVDVVITREPSFGGDSPASVEYATEDGTASSGSHLTHITLP